MNTLKSTPTTTRSLRHVLFADATDDQWNDWHWQWDHRLTSPVDFGKAMRFSKSEMAFFDGNVRSRLPFAVTPYYATVMDSDDFGDPIRRCIVPTVDEYDSSPGDMPDPLAESNHSPLPGVIHRNKDRVVLLTANDCPTYCRYCTRGRMVGRSHSLRPRSTELEDAISYIADHPHVHDVLISGGEPLLWSDDDLFELLQRLAVIPHLDYVRIGTKTPMTLPQRITSSLCAALKSADVPVLLSIHATHPSELTHESRTALNRLADAGLALGTQTVLLKGVNDSVETLSTLFRGLLRCRVRPYYLLMCDPVSGSSRFWVPVEQAKRLVNALRDTISGYAVPHLIMDLPGGGGKISITQDYQIDENASATIYANCSGETGFSYPKNP
jgi:lysine 2,3-aminomutase